MPPDLTEGQEGFYSVFISPDIAHDYLDNVVKKAPLNPFLTQDITVYGDIDSHEFGGRLYFTLLNKALQLADYGEWFNALKLVQETTGLKTFFLKDGKVKTNAVEQYRRVGVGIDYAAQFEVKDDPEILSGNLHKLIYEYTKAKAISWSLTGDARDPESQKNIAAIQKDNGEFKRFNELLAEFGIERQNFEGFIESQMRPNRRIPSKLKIA